MLIGRAPEKDVLDHAVAGARVGESGVVVLVGEPGIGKSTLLRYAVERAEGMRVLRASGSMLERDVSFGGLLQLLRPVLDRLESIPPPQARALSVALALQEGVIGDRFAVGAACLSLLSRCAEERPLLIVVDDAHALDRPSADTVLFVARRLMADPIAVVVATRPEAGTPLLGSGLRELELSGLAMGEARLLVGAHATAPVSAETLARLQEATQGNPLALEELTADLPALERLAPHRPVPVPATLAASFRRRTERLSADTRLALLVTVVADGDLGLVEQAASATGVAPDLLGPAEAAGLVRVADGRAEFRHPLVGAGIYADASAAQRRQAHLAVADALPEHDLEKRAWNRAEATLGTDEQVSDDLDTVAQRAGKRGAHAVAATAYERAAVLTRHHARRARTYFAAGESAWLAGHEARAEELLSLATGETDDPLLLGAIDSLRGTIALRAGSLDDAGSVLDRAATAVSPHDPALAVGMLADLVQVCFYRADTATGLAAADRIAGLLGRPGSDPARVRGVMAMGVARVLAGEPGIDLVREAVSQLDGVPGWASDPHRPTWAVVGTLFLRESGSGRKLLSEAVAALRDAGALALLPSLLFYTARDDATTDRWQDAVAGYGEGIALGRESGQTTDLAMSLAGLAWLDARCGREAECRSHAAEALQLAHRQHINLAEAWATYALGDLELALGRAEQAQEHYSGLDALLAEIGFLDVDLSPAPELVDALLRLGEPGQARAVAHAFHDRAAAKGQPWALARAERALAEADPGPTREEHFRRALGLHGASPDAFETARTQLAHGSALRRARSRQAARAPLRESLATFERLGARPWADRAATELEATGETAHRHGGNRLDLLTSQEQQIAKLLGDGRTTKQAAAALFLSPKTVEYHLRHVYLKLGIGSRGELAAALTDQPPAADR